MQPNTTDAYFADVTRLPYIPGPCIQPYNKAVQGIWPQSFPVTMQKPTCRGLPTKVVALTLTSCFVLVIYIYLYMASSRGLYYRCKTFATDRSIAPLPEQERLDCFTNGHWEKSTQQFSAECEEQLNIFFRTTRDRLKLPSPLQRGDGKCGNVTFIKQEWFRAVCDPFASTPCCYKGTCKDLPVAECECEDCYDLRPTLHGELSQWVGHQPSCPLHNFTSQEACQVLRGKTLVFIGDCFTRHLFQATQILLSDNDEDCCMKETTETRKPDFYKGLYVFTNECRPFVPEEDEICGVSLRRHIIYRRIERSEVISLVEQHVPRGDKTVLFIFSLGLHYNLNAFEAINKTLGPGLDTIMGFNNKRVSAIVLLSHSYGPLKTPNLPNQLNPSALRFNREIRAYLHGRRVPFIDAYNLTKNLASYDGTHYPKASNLLKLQVLLNHILYAI